MNIEGLKFSVYLSRSTDSAFVVMARKENIFINRKRNGGQMLL